MKNVADLRKSPAGKARWLRDALEPDPDRNVKICHSERSEESAFLSASKSRFLAPKPGARNRQFHLDAVIRNTP
jgi:hypothetical protein